MHFVLEYFRIYTLGFEHAGRRVPNINLTGKLEYETRKKNLPTQSLFFAERETIKLGTSSTYRLEQRRIFTATTEENCVQIGNIEGIPSDLGDRVVKFYF